VEKSIGKFAVIFAIPIPLMVPLKKIFFYDNHQENKKRKNFLLEKS
jgi:hypothetical protein